MFLDKLTGGAGFSRQAGIAALSLTSLFLVACRETPPDPPPTYPVAEFTGKVIDRNWREHDWSNFDRCDLALENAAGQRKVAHFDYPDADNECNGSARPLIGDVLTIRSNGYVPPDSEIWSVSDATLTTEKSPVPSP